MIKLILFDLGGVYFGPGTAQAIVKLAKMWKLPEIKLKEQLATFGDNLGRKIRRGEITYAEFLDQVFPKLGIADTAKHRKLLTETWFGSYVEQPLMRKLVEQLRKKYTLGILTNNFTERVAYLDKKYQFSHLFTYTFISSELQCRKPESLIFKKVLKALNGKYKPSEILFIDDNEKNVNTAKEFGMDAIVFHSEQSLRDGIEKARDTIFTR